MKKTTTPPFFDLLKAVYPKISEGQEDASTALLAHCAELVRDPNYGPRAGDSKTALKVLALLNPKNRGQQLSGHAGASLVRAALVEVVTPWRPRENAQIHTPGWGWAALQDAVIQHDTATIRVLLNAEHAPSSAEINKLIFTYEVEGEINQAPQIAKSNLAGMLVRSHNVGSRPKLLEEAVSVLIQAGVDFNSPIGPGLLRPLAYSRFSSTFEAMLQGGVSTNARGVDGVSALTQAFLNAHPAQHSLMIDSCLKMAQDNPELVRQIRKDWPQLIEAWGRQLGGNRNSSSSDKDLARVFALSSFVGMPLGSKKDDDPNLFASWARSKLAMIHKSSHNYQDIRRMSDWKEITSNLDIPNKWTGSTEDGIPNGAWGMMVSAQHESYRKSKSFSREMAGVFSANHGEEFWPGTLRLFEKLAQEPCTWQAVQILQSAIPRPMLREFRKVAMEGFISNRETHLVDKIPGYEEAGILANVATQCLKPIAKGAEEIRDPELVTLAIRVHLLHGMRGGVALRALEQLSTSQPNLVDAPALKRSLEVSRDTVDPEIVSRVEAILMTVDTPQVSKIGQRPRL